MVDLVEGNKQQTLGHQFTLIVPHVKQRTYLLLQVTLLQCITAHIVTAYIVAKLWFRYDFRLSWFAARLYEPEGLFAFFCLCGGKHVLVVIDALPQSTLIL